MFKFSWNENFFCKKDSNQLKHCIDILCLRILKRTQQLAEYSKSFLLDIGTFCVNNGIIIAFLLIMVTYFAVIYRIDEIRRLKFLKYIEKNICRNTIVECKDENTHPLNSNKDKNKKGDSVYFFGNRQVNRCIDTVQPIKKIDSEESIRKSQESTKTDADLDMFPERDDESFPDWCELVKEDEDDNGLTSEEGSANVIDNEYKKCTISPKIEVLYTANHLPIPNESEKNRQYFNNAAAQKSKPIGRELVSETKNLNFHLQPKFNNVIRNTSLKRNSLAFQKDSEITKLNLKKEAIFDEAKNKQDNKRVKFQELHKYYKKSRLFRSSTDKLFNSNLDNNRFKNEINQKKHETSMPALLTTRTTTKKSVPTTITSTPPPMP